MEIYRYWVSNNGRAIVYAVSNCQLLNLELSATSALGRVIIERVKLDYWLLSL